MAQSDFDPYENRNVEAPLSNCDALTSLMKGVIGTGILALPLAFHYAGFIAGSILTAFCTALLVYGMQLLVGKIMCMVESSRRNSVGYMTFPETVEYSFSVGPKCCRYISKVVGFFIDGILALSHYGVCVVYIVFVALNIKQLLDQVWPNLKYLVPTNILANILLYVGFACILYYFCIGLPPLGERELFKYDLALFFGIVLFAVSSVGVMLAIEQKMAKPAQYLGWCGVLARAGILITVTCVLFGFFGYWRYGDQVEGSVTLNVPTEEVLAKVIKVFISVAVFLTYPLSGYVPIDIIMNHYLKKYRELKHPHMIEYIIRTAFVIVCTLNAIAFPNLGPLLALVGAFSISILNIIAPCCIELCLFYHDTYGKLKWKLWKNIVIILFGTLVFVYGSYRAVVDIIREYGGKKASTKAKVETPEVNMLSSTTRPVDQGYF
ncbi:glutamate transporter polyphemus-like isoform X3 [Drosophila novamexicana]|uniref:glutamate transporter polyphemus-like isoform X3 n=1 Tax=Drosophila novamexicana TaxID=47314 RepID=UPI0011E5BF76|nr:glutamate transporter polyphemus-like isoform X3 [Drosophila novamexicana]